MFFLAGRMVGANTFWKFLFSGCEASSVAAKQPWTRPSPSAYEHYRRRAHLDYRRTAAPDRCLQHLTVSPCGDPFVIQDPVVIQSLFSNPMFCVRIQFFVRIRFFFLDI